MEDSTQIAAADRQDFEQDGPDLFAVPQVSEVPQVTGLDETIPVAPNLANSEPAVQLIPNLNDPLPEPGDRNLRPRSAEAPLALYRRYRPDTFANVIGQEHVTEPLMRALKNNRVNHAYLFSGPRGCGKTTSARILARALNCETGPVAVPCGECQSCRELARGGGGSIDVIEIDAASHGNVDEARDLRERAFFAPVRSRFKIYIIDEAHMVTPQGFNALLKVVEEPPPHVKFIFATTEPEKVLGTIRSRTHHYPFRLVPPKTLTEYLARLCAAESVTLDPSVLPLVVRAGGGSVRDSLSVLDQLLGGAGADGVTYAQASALLGYTPATLLDDLMDSFAAGDAAGVFSCLDRVIETGQDPRRFGEDVLERLRDLIIVEAVPDALSSGLVSVSADQADRLRVQAAALGPGELARAGEVMANGLQAMRGTTSPRLFLELMCARVLLPGADVDERGIHARLDRIERRLGMGRAGFEHTGAIPKLSAIDFKGGESTESATKNERAAQTVTQSAVESNNHGTPGETSGHDLLKTKAEVSHNSVNHQAEVADGETISESSTNATATKPALRQTDSPDLRLDENRPENRPNPPDSANPDMADPITSGLNTSDLRRMWPQVLDELSNLRRFAWVLVSQNAHVVGVAGQTVTLGMSSPGARDSFDRGGLDEIVGQAITNITGVEVQVESIIDSGSGPKTRPTQPPNPNPNKSTDRPAVGQTSQFVQAAKENIRPMRQGTPESEELSAPSRDDLEIRDDDRNAPEMLAEHLGAQLIDEERHV